MASSAMLDFMFLRSQPIAVTLLVLVGGYGISFLLKAYRERRLTKGLVCSLEDMRESIIANPTCSQDRPLTRYLEI